MRCTLYVLYFAVPPMEPHTSVFFTFDVALRLEFPFLPGEVLQVLYILDAMGAPPNTIWWWKRWNLYMQLRSMRMFGSRLEEKRPFLCGTSHLLGEYCLDPRPMLSQGLHWTHSLPPVEILSIVLHSTHPFHLESRPKHLPKRLHTGLMMIKTSATLGRTTSERVKPALRLVFPRRPPQLSPADPRVNGNLLRDMGLSRTGDDVFRGEDCGDMLPCFARKLRLGLEHSRLIATATVAGCSDRRHFYLLADRCVPFLIRCRCIHAACFLRSHLILV